VCITKTREKERERERTCDRPLLEIEKIARAFLNNGARSVLSGRAKNDNTTACVNFMRML